MSTRFERFAEMAKEEFGLIVSQSHDGERSTFESLFGISAKAIAEYQLPYNIVTEHISYYDVEPILNSLLVMGTKINRFENNNTIALAA